jgi:U3 small nucleolar RNA-associated protein 21
MYLSVIGLTAVAADDKVLRLYDVVAARLVRMFHGHTDRITDICFSEDGKLLLSSAMDSTVRVWDVVASKQIDAMHVGTAVTALSLSPAMDLLATSHVNRNGIYLW